MYQIGTCVVICSNHSFLLQSERYVSRASLKYYFFFVKKLQLINDQFKFSEFKLWYLLSKESVRLKLNYAVNCIIISTNFLSPKWRMKRAKNAAFK